jgi:hypothetical protein
MIVVSAVRFAVDAVGMQDGRDGPVASPYVADM